MTFGKQRTIKTVVIAALAATITFPSLSSLWAQQRDQAGGVERMHDAHANAPATQPTGEAPATRPAADPQAQAALQAVSDAYAKLPSLELAGRYSADLDVGGQQMNEAAEFTSSYAAPNKFRHVMKDDLTAGSTGTKLYLQAPDRSVPGGQVYAQLDAPEGKLSPEKVPTPVAQVVLQQNPALGLTVLEDPLGAFTGQYGQPRATGKTELDGKTFETITLGDGEKDAVVTLLVDPSTRLLRRLDVDLRSVLENRGATDVKSAKLAVDYTTVTPGGADGGGAAAPAADAFAWAPPAGAREVPAAPPAAGAGEGEQPGQAAMALVGKPAPGFVLKNLDDKDVKLADQKGSVVVLDFWATWCGPCIQAMPGIEKLHTELGPQGLKVFAVNVQEDKDTVRGFLTGKNFTLPALLDTDGKVSEQYKAMAIPQTVVIGKDGVVKKVFVGSGHDTEKQIRAAVDEATKG